MARARPTSATSPTAPARRPIWSDEGVWQLADGVLFSVLSSMVLWGIIITSVYQALS
jgi:hypothetical protein